VKRPEKEVAAKKKRSTAARSKRPKDYPRRPLSAYNIFFREERARLLAARQANKNEGEKIGFEKMAKTIGSRWKELPKEELERFKKLASEDTERYRSELDEYNLGLARKGRQQREEMARKKQEEAVPVGSNPYPQQPQQQFGMSGVGPFDTSNDMGCMGGSHLATLVQGAEAAPPPASATTNYVNSFLPQQQMHSVSAQVSQILAARGTPAANTSGRFEQELREFVAMTQNTGNLRAHQFQDSLFMSNMPSQQQQSPLPQRVDIEEQLRQNLYSRVCANQANQDLLASMQSQAALHQRLQLVRALQQGGGNNSNLLPTFAANGQPPTSERSPHPF